MARTIIVSLILALVSPLWGEQIGVTEFKYLNNNDNSMTIDQGQAQDLLNVDIRPGGKSVKKRDGYGLYKDLNTDKGVHGGHHFFDSTGNDVQIWGSSTSLWGIVADGTPTQIVSTGTLNATWDCADTQGSAYCVDSSRDAYIKTDGTTKTWYTSPLGTMVEITPERAVVAGVSGSPNTLYFSESSVFTNFTVGIAETSPFTEVIASPGSKITHIRYGCGKILWWKDQSFGYLNGSTQFDLENKIVSDTIGTFDNTSAIDPGGNVWFRGQDGHIWKYDCSALTKESIEITPNIQTSGKRSSNYWTQTTESDFNSGSKSSTTVSGDKVFISTNNADGASNTSFETAAPAGSFYALNWTTSTTTGSLNLFRSANNTFYNCTHLPYDGSWNINSAGSFVASPTWTVSLVDLSSSALVTVTPNQDYSCAWTTYTLSATSIMGQGVKIRIRLVGTGTDSSLYSSSFTLSNDVQFRAISAHFTGLSDSAMSFDYFTGGTNSISSGTYLSAVKNAPNLTAFDTFSASKVDNGGTISFFVRSSTSSFTVASSTPAWTAQTLGAVPTISTGTYFQMKASFTITAATQTPTLNDFTFNWYEGAASDQAYSEYFDNSIWFTVPYGPGISENNYIFKRDLINDGWTLYDFGTGGFAVQNNRLYFGQVSGDNLFKYGTGTSDNGSAITSYWKSKDFAGSDPFLQNTHDQIDTIWKQNSNQTATVTYTLDTSSSTAYTVNLSSTTNSIINNRKNLPQKLGYTINWKFGDTSATSNWELLGFRFTISPQPYRPSR